MANFCPHSFRMTHLKTLYFCALKLLNLQMRLLIFCHCDSLVEHLKNDSIQRVQHIHLWNPICKSMQSTNYMFCQCLVVHSDLFCKN